MFRLAQLANSTEPAPPRWSSRSIHPVSAAPQQGLIMRLVTYSSDSGPRSAVLRDQQVIDIQNAAGDLPSTVRGLLALGDDGMRQAEAATKSVAGEPLANVRLLAPIPDPPKVICIGLNYADHAAESGLEPPTEPVVFNKFPNAVIASGEDIVLPSVSSQVDYEAELVVVIGRGGRHIRWDDALQHVAGYACGHDVSARDWQLGRPGGQWLLGKTFDTFAPCGPFLATRDEIDDPGSLDIQLRLNGKVMQDSNTRQLIFPIPELVAHLSTIFTLQPGDLIYTGTPPGVGMARDPAVYLKAGDRVEVEIAGLGVLENGVAAE